MGKKKSIGLPGGPNEFLQDITQYISVEGFKSYSPDKNNPVNIIESGSITMQDVDFPVLGTDNLGNSQMMFPENDYQFPGDMVFEIPIAQEGDETVQTEFEIDDRTGKINTRKGYDESKLFEFIKDKYKKIDTSTQKNDLVNKLSSPAFRERYKKNIFNITGENLSDEELTSRINSQVDFTAAGPDFNIKMPFVTHTSDKGYMRGTTPFIQPFGDNQDLYSANYKGIYQNNTIDELEALRKEYQQHLGSNPKPLALDFPEFSQYPYMIQLADKRESGIMGDRDVLPFDTEDSTIVHEYAHSYNTKNAPLFKPEGKNYSKLDRDTYEAVPGGQYKNWLSNLFGEDYFTKEGQPYGSWAMKPWEISSIRAQNEQRLKNANIWDNTKGEFDESNLNKMLKSRSFNPDGAENMHLDKLGYNELERINYNKKKLNRKQEEFNSVIDGRRGASNTDYIINNIINPENKPAMDMDTFSTIFNSSQNDLKDKQKYSDYNSLLEDYNGTNKRKKKRATEVLDVIYSGVKNQLNQEYTEEKEKLQNTFDEKKKEVLPKMKMYFNEIAMENPNEPVMAQQGYEFRQSEPQNFFQREIFDYKNFADKLASPVTAFGYSARNEPIPKGLNVSNPERNNLDMLVDIYNPFAWYQYAENADQNFEEGKILDGVLNTLGAIPIIPAWLSRAKINKLINPKGSTAIKDQVKKWSGNTPRNLDDITLVKGERPPHVIKKPKTGGPTDDVMPDGANLQTPLQQLAEGADSFKATIQKRLNDLKPGSEGFERLIEAEAKYLQSVGQPYSKVFAERNALARYNELMSAKGNTINDNALAMWKDAIGDPKHVNHRIARELFKNQPGLYYNAWFRNAPRSAVLEAGDFVPKRLSDPITGLEMPMPKNFATTPNIAADLKRLGKESIPGKLTTGMKYSNNAPVEVHEINHLLQASRRMPLDDYARRLTPSENLSKSGKAQWDYFQSGSGGQEPTSYLAELRQAMLDRGIIKNVYDKITPNKLIQAEVSFANKPRGFYDYGWDLGGKNSGYLSNTRVLDLYEKTAKNREILSNALNKLPAVIPVVGAGTALSQEQDGGSITPELLMKQAYVESNWDPNIVNSKGYTGLGQIGPQLAQDYKKANKIKGDINLLDPKVNADIQEWSMNELMNSSFINKGNSTDEVKLAKALAAYNWGRGNMSKMLVKQKDAGVDIYRSLDWLSELPKETLEYYKMITTDNFNPETRPLMQQDYLKALENDSIIQNYYKKSGGEYSVFKDYVNGKYNNTKHENHAEKIYDKLNRIHYREAKEAGMSPANFIMTNISRYS